MLLSLISVLATYYVISRAALKLYEPKDPWSVTIRTGKVNIDFKMADRPAKRNENALITGFCNYSCVADIEFVVTKNSDQYTQDVTFRHEATHAVVTNLLYYTPELCKDMTIQEYCARIGERLLSTYDEEELNELPSSQLQVLILDLIDEVHHEEEDLLRREYNVEYPTNQQGRLIVNVMTMFARTLKYNEIYRLLKNKYRARRA